jgi:hypothetical protein
MQNTITRSEENKDLNAPQKAMVNANGTWQSIAKWGENNGLDKEQQTGFEILAAMYVLSLYYDEAIVEEISNRSYDAFVEGKNGLCKLARWNMETEEPLCMFITGPAGAGKCKSKNKWVHSKMFIQNLTNFEKAKILAKKLSQNIGHNFTNRTILLTAITGSAAMEIGGCTAALVMAYLQKQEYTRKEDI